MPGSVPVGLAADQITVADRAEQELIDAEFAAIVAASWPDGEPGRRTRCDLSERRPEGPPVTAPARRPPPERPARTPRRRPVQRPPPRGVAQHRPAVRGR